MKYIKSISSFASLPMLVSTALTLLVSFGNCFADARGGGTTIATGKAFYWVPGDKTVAEFSGFVVPDFELKQVGSDLKAEYTLPQELTGIGQRVEFVGSATPDSEGKVTLTSYKGKIICKLPARSCSTRYEQLQFDPIAAEAYFKTLTPSAADLSIRMTILSAFSTESIGFLLY
jgi:hypothetical protein